MLTISAWYNPNEHPGYDGIFSSRAANWGITMEGGSEATTHIDFRLASRGGAGSQGADSAAGRVSASGGWYHVAIYNAGLAGNDASTVTIVSVPEPSVALLGGLGLFGLLRRRRA